MRSGFVTSRDFAGDARTIAGEWRPANRFDGWGTMEVDLLCADSRVVVEVDGAQHLADPVAYRRDRRKDQLLQQNGYLVLRVLAEDVAKGLDSVLDGILRSLTARRRPATTTHALTVMQRSRT